MSTNDAFDRQVRDWLGAEGNRAVPPGLAETVVAATANRRPRPAWLVAMLGAGYGSAAGARTAFGRPLVVVWLAALLVLALVAGILAFGASRNPFLVTATNEPSASALVADASPTPSVGTCPGAIGAWPAPSVPAGPPSAAKPGLLAGVGQVGTGNDGEPIVDVFTLDPFFGINNGPGALKRVTTLGLPAVGASNERTLNWAPDGSALAVDTPSGPTMSGCTEPIIVAGGRLYRPFPIAAGTADVTHGSVWSPDGSRLAGVRYPADLTQPGNVVIANRDGSAPESLPTVCEQCQPVQGSWSPDGAILAFAYVTMSAGSVTGPLGVAFYTFGTGTWETHELGNHALSVLGWLGGHRLLVELQPTRTPGTLVTVSPHTLGEQGVGTGHGHPSPDGNLVLIETDAAVGGNFVATLSVLDLQTGATRPLPAGGAWPQIDDIVWAPDESAVALGVSDSEPIPALGDRTGTWLVPLDGSEARQLTGPEFSPTSWQPVWSAP